MPAWTRSSSARQAESDAGRAADLATPGRERRPGMQEHGRSTFVLSRARRAAYGGSGQYSMSQLEERLALIQEPQQPPFQGQDSQRENQRGKGSGMMLDAANE